MSDNKEALFPIRTVSELTGVNSITLRAWERRYGLIQPQRTAKKHRLYSMQDVEFIHRVLDVLKQGISIGRVRHILGTSKEPLQRHLQPDANTDQTIANVSGEEENLWESYRHKMQQAIEQFNTAVIDRMYHEVASQYPLYLVRQHLLVPLLQQAAEKGKNLAAASGEYHFFSQYLRNRIAVNYLNIMLKTGQSKKGFGVLMACFAEQDCDIHLMLLATELATQGYHSVLLGNHLAADALPLSLSRSKLDGVVLYENTIDTMDFNRLQALVATLDKPLFIMGQASNTAQKKLAAMNTTWLAEDNYHRVQTIVKRLKAD